MLLLKSGQSEVTEQKELTDDEIIALQAPSFFYEGLIPYKEMIRRVRNFSIYELTEKTKRANLLNVAT